MYCKPYMLGGFQHLNKTPLKLNRFSGSRKTVFRDEAYFCRIWSTEQPMHPENVPVGVNYGPMTLFAVVIAKWLLSKQNVIIFR